MRDRTIRLLNVYCWTALAYVIIQESLNVFSFYCSPRANSQVFMHPHWYLYFSAPAISAVLVLSSFLILKRYYRPKEDHIFLHILSWLFLFVPQMFPPFIAGLNIIYTSWAFILTTTAAGSVAFRDLAYVEVEDVEKPGLDLVYEEMKFYLDKLANAWLALGGIISVCMTILWTAPNDAFKMDYSGRVFSAVYMLFCFVAVTVLVAIFVGYPIFRTMRKIRPKLGKKR